MFINQIVFILHYSNFCFVKKYIFAPGAVYGYVLNGTILWTSVENIKIISTFISVNMFMSWLRIWFSVNISGLISQFNEMNHCIIAHWLGAYFNCTFHYQPFIWLISLRTLSSQSSYPRKCLFKQCMIWSLRNCTHVTSVVACANMQFGLMYYD